jgi:hypothetical protein
LAENTGPPRPQTAASHKAFRKTGGCQSPQPPAPRGLATGPTQRKGRARPRPPPGPQGSALAAGRSPKGPFHAPSRPLAGVPAALEALAPATRGPGRRRAPAEKGPFWGPGRPPAAVCAPGGRGQGRAPKRPFFSWGLLRPGPLVAGAGARQGPTQKPGPGARGSRAAAGTLTKKAVHWFGPWAALLLCPRRAPVPRGAGHSRGPIQKGPSGPKSCAERRLFWVAGARPQVPEPLRRARVTL